MLSRRIVLTGSVGAMAAYATPARSIEAHSSDPAIVQYWNFRIAILHTLQKPFLGTGNVILLGDSRVEASMWSKIAGRKVHNCAMAGFSYTSALPYLPELLGRLKPSAIISALPWIPEGDPVPATRDAAIALNMCRRSTPRVCAVVMPGWEAGFSGLGQTPTDQARPRSKLMNAESREHFQPLCKSIGVPVVDLAARMSLNDTTLKPGMTIDSIHFSAAGFAQLKIALRDAIALAVK